MQIGRRHSQVRSCGAVKNPNRFRSIWKTSGAFRFTLSNNIERAAHANDRHVEFSEDVSVIFDERFFEKKIVDDDVQAGIGDGGYGPPHAFE